MKIETPILKRLGPVPFWRGRDRCLDTLEAVYRRAAEKARHVLAGAEPGQETGTASKTAGELRARGKIW